MAYQFSDVKKVMRSFSAVNNKTARVELEQLASDLFSRDMKAGEIIDIVNRVMRITLLNEGIEKE